jgi:hypothetical protein
LNNASKNAPLLILDLGLDIIDCVRGLNLKSDSFTRKGLDEDLHLAVSRQARVTSEVKQSKPVNLCARRTDALVCPTNGGVFDRGKSRLVRRRKWCRGIYGARIGVGNKFTVSRDISRKIIILYLLITIDDLHIISD